MPSDIFRAGSTARISETGVLDRCEAVPKLIGNPQDFLIIAGLAGTAKDTAHLCEPHANYFLCWGHGWRHGYGPWARPGAAHPTCTGDDG